MVKVNSKEELEELKAKGYDSFSDVVETEEENTKKGKNKMDKNKKRKVRSDAELIACYQEKVNRASLTVKKYTEKIARLQKKGCANKYKNAAKSVNKMTIEQLAAFESWKKANGIG